MQKDILEYKNKTIECIKRIEDSRQNIVHVEEIGNIMEYYDQDGVMFSVQINEDVYTINFGDEQYVIPEKLFNDIKL